MPREVVTLSVGQAGNQLGLRFWELAVQEHAAHDASGRFPDSMSPLFRNVDAGGADLPLSRGRGPLDRQPVAIEGLRARAVLVDMEEGVVAGVLRGPLGELFDSRQLLTDVSGSGNNWAHGYACYGALHGEGLSDLIRGQAEACDSLQGFQLMHSLGGGTGSGLGSYLLEQLADEYPAAERWTASVFPSPDADDVVTSPYNACLSLAKLAEHATAVVPLDNAALSSAAAAAEGRRGGRHGVGAGSAGAAAGQGAPFDALNALAAGALLHALSSSRFGGAQGWDLGQLSASLAPYPRLHFLLAGVAPLRDAARQAPGRALDQACVDLLAPGRQLLSLALRQHAWLACGLLARGGGLEPSDLARSAERLLQQARLPAWNPGGVRMGVCAQPPLGAPASLLCLANSCGMGGTAAALHQRFSQLYGRRLYLHHYTQYIEPAELDAASEAVASLADAYQQLGVSPGAAVPPNLAQLCPGRGGSGFGQSSLAQERPAAMRRVESQGGGGSGLRR